MIYKFPIFIFLFLHLLNAQGQSIRISGKIIDKQTLEGIPFAHISIETTPIGAISDLYGDFILDYPKHLQSGVISISCLGYKTVKVSLSSISGLPLEISLQQNTVELQEVVVKPEDPLNLLKEAIRKIPENYDTSSTVLSGNYKMSSLLEDKNIRYTEAFIDIFKRPYQTYSEDNNFLGDSIHLREARIKRNEIEDWKLRVMLPWEKSLYMLENRDIVKEFGSKKNAFQRFIKSYLFDIEKMLMINGRHTYMISLKPKKNKKNTYWNGHIYLDEETKAFVKFDLVSTPKMFKKLRADIGYIIISKLYKVKYKQGEWKESVSYQLIGDKWHFKEVNSSKQFLVSSKKREMDLAPVNVNLHYRTNDVKSNIAFSDTVDFLNPKEPEWMAEKSMVDKYRASFWSKLDKERGVMPSGAFITKNDRKAIEKKTYTFSRLDTLQGKLTPLRTCFDVGFYHLTVEVLPQEEIIKGSSLIRFKVIDATDRIQIDLYSGMSVDSIIYQGKAISFKREFNAIYINFPEILPKGTIDEVIVYFSGRPVDLNPEIPMYGSFLWAEDENGNPWLQAICQGYGASGWWPNKDHLSDEPDSAAISVITPSDLDVVANGRLQRKIQLENGKTRFDWFVSYPINNYNLTLNVGKYAHFKDKYVNGQDTIDLDYHVMPYNLENARKKVEMVKPMFKTYEKFFGKYPFSHDGFKLVETPYAMEHQSCVSVGAEYFGASSNLDFENAKPDLENGVIDAGIVLHETAHEWWGNSVSCTDNAELWIHEAFATYAEALYIEDHYGYEDSQVYLNSMKKEVKNQAPIIGKFDVNHIHYDIGDMYFKGALMLNTLRHMINNDSLWFSLLKGIQSEFKYKSATTTQIVQFINQKTRTDYTPFFDEYLKFPKIPKLELVFEKKKRKTYLHHRWVSNVESFKMPVKYTISDKGTGYLFPTSNWQKTEFADLNKGDFNVNSDQLYIHVEMKDSK
ncbi:M1 family aminopeptidase [Fulvivirgaceae bacterium BMA10]|uniref:M1 family aminopeptidase n=1 Tax=Splendidivirga corallicola TaxID=3051826 RepID=A0ABT8KJU1_9BACT|nr:M1 family aminopeptidase [Fulvivirgaceae bacterium BMA10]